MTDQVLKVSPKISSRVAVLVPLYKPELSIVEAFSFSRTLALLSVHDVFVIGPTRLKYYFSKLEREYENRFSTVCFEDGYFSGIPGYNALLKSKAFYQTFSSYEFMLIAQTDALIIRDDLEEWCMRGYSYVGAPIFHGFEAPVGGHCFLGVGNGGFSLRKISDFIKALSRLRHIPNFISPSFHRRKNTFFDYHFLLTLFHEFIFAYSFSPFKPRINEDLFWGMLVPSKCDFFTIPSPLEAAKFSFDVAPKYLFEAIGKELPFGCHGWERRDRQFWEKTLSDIGINLPSMVD